jgi:outer membrane protein TolC
VNLAQDRYRRGQDGLRVTHQKKRRLLKAERQHQTTQRARRSARVNLIQALGGPWDLDPVTTDLSMTSADSNEGAQP